jgi:DNA replication and repair protein RecF
VRKQPTSHENAFADRERSEAGDGRNTLPIATGAKWRMFAAIGDADPHGIRPSRPQWSPDGPDDRPEGGHGVEVRTLRLVDFRNYAEAYVELGPGVNMVIGRNGQGKTNLLEAVYVLSAVGSYRAPNNAALVRHGAERAVIRAGAGSRGRDIEIAAEVRRTGGIRLLVNRVPLERAREMEGMLGAVLFSPEDLSLVKGGPEERRRYLDHAAARGRPSIAARRQELDRALKQRNGVLRAAQVNRRALRTLEVWDEQLTKIGAAVVRNRIDVLEALRPHVARRHGEVGAGEVDLTYRAAWLDDGAAQPRLEQPEGAARMPLTAADGPDALTARLESALLAALTRSLERDIERAVTSAGPHRDDLEVRLGGSDARSFASQGEERSIALALRLAERDLAAEVLGENPVLLLDDVFSELDEARRAQLGDLIRATGQAIVTATSLPGEAGQAPGARTYEVDGGVIREVA